MIRSRTRWFTLADRPTKYFLNLEKRNFDDTTISAIFNEQGILLSSPPDILDLKKKHFSDQHARSADSYFNPLTEEDTFSSAPAPPLEDIDRDMLNEDLDIDSSG